MTIQVVLKQTQADQPIGLRTRQLFLRSAGVKIAGIITNGNAREILPDTDKPIFHMGDKGELDSLIRRYRRDKRRIHDIEELDPSGMTLVDTDFDPLSTKFDRSVFQHWTRGVEGRGIYFDERESPTAVVDRGAVISTYLILSKLREITDSAFVNIVKSGPQPKPKSGQEVERTIQRAIGNDQVRITRYSNGVRYYDIMITIFAKTPVTQEQIGQMLENTPRIIVDRADLGAHNIPKMEVDAIRSGKLRPPVVACITREREASTIQTIRLNTEPKLVVAAANLDATQILSGIERQHAMIETDLAIGIRD